MIAKIFDGASRIQSIVRGFLARNKARLLKREKDEGEVIRQARLAAVRRAQEAEAFAAAEAAAKVAQDIFFHTNAGHASVVDRLFNDMNANPPRSAADVNDEGETILQVAAAAGHVDIVQRCVWWGFALNHRNKNEETAIMLAAKNGHEHVVSFLLDLPKLSGRDKFRTKNLVIKNQDAALMTTSAARNGNLRILKKLCDYGVSIDARLPVTGESALQIACECNHADVIRFLVSQRCNIMSADDRGVTALMKACSSSSQAARILLGLSEESHVLLKKLDKETSMLLTIRDSEGKDCYLHAALNGREDILEMFSQLVTSSASSRSYDEDSQPAPFFVEDDGRIVKRPVHWVQADISRILQLIRDGHMGCISHILEEGFNPSLAEDGTGQTIFLCACEHGRTELVDMLMRRGITLSICDAMERNCFHYAARCSTVNMVDTLLHHQNAHKCKVNEHLLDHLDAAGDNLLHIAARFGSTISEDIMHRGDWIRSLSQRNKCGLTPLLEACKHRRQDIVKQYLRLGASALEVDHFNHSCLWYFLHPSSEVERNESKDYGEAALDLVRGGCSLYESPLAANNFELQRETLASNDPGDFAVVVLGSITLGDLRDFYRKTDENSIFRLVISAFAYERDSCYAIRALLDRPTIASLADKFLGGFTLLGWAAVCRHVEAVEFLLSYGGISGTQRVDTHGNTILHLAAAYGGDDMLAVIVSRGRIADIDVESGLGLTAARIAAKNGNLSTVHMLHKKYGASAREALEGKYWGWLLALALREIMSLRPHSS